MAEAPGYELECLQADGTPPALPTALPEPTLAPELVAEVHRGLERLRAVIRRQPVWCLPENDIYHDHGALRFDADGSVSELATGGVIRSGKVLWPNETMGDDRIEIRLEAPAQSSLGPRLYHLNVNESDRLENEHEELVPGDGCLRR
jgi:hypothetical protein